MRWSLLSHRVASVSLFCHITSQPISQSHFLTRHVCRPTRSPRHWQPVTSCCTLAFTHRSNRSHISTRGSVRLSAPFLLSSGASLSLISASASIGSRCRWSAASGSLDPGAWLLFSALYFWQIPHFLALAWTYKADYIHAGNDHVSKVPSQRCCLMYGSQDSV